jgi:hypothetical protein
MIQIAGGERLATQNQKSKNLLIKVKRMPLKILPSRSRPSRDMVQVMKSKPNFLTTMRIQIRNL